MKTFTVATALVLASFSIELFGQEKHGFTNEFLKDSEGNILKDPYKSQMDWVNGLFPEKHKEGYKVSKNDSSELRLKKQIANAIYMEVISKEMRYSQGQDPVWFMLEAYKRWHLAREAVHQDEPEQLIKIAEDMIQHAKLAEAQRWRRHGIGRPDEWQQALAYRLQCELRLEQLKNKPSTSQDLIPCQPVRPWHKSIR